MQNPFMFEAEPFEFYSEVSDIEESLTTGFARSQQGEAQTCSCSQSESEDWMGEMEWEEEATKASSFRYVKSFASSDADCVVALNVAKKNRAQALDGVYVTHEDRANPGKFGAIYCTTQFVFEINGRTNYPAGMKQVCEDIQIRR